MELNKIFPLKTVKTSKPGELHFTDVGNFSSTLSNDEINVSDKQKSFIIKRLFLLNNFYDLNENNNKRGLHANINFDEIIIVNEGYIDVKIIKKNKEEIEFRLNKNECLYFSRGYWLEFIIGNSSTSITVLANVIQSESISMYDFDKFINQS
jgi:hypothetical protein